MFWEHRENKWLNLLLFTILSISKITTHAIIHDTKTPSTDWFYIQISLSWKQVICFRKIKCSKGYAVTRSFYPDTCPDRHIIAISLENVKYFYPFSISQLLQIGKYIFLLNIKKTVYFYTIILVVYCVILLAFLVFYAPVQPFSHRSWYLHS